MDADTRLCQTIAGATGRPVTRSQRIVVSRWLVMPMAATRSAEVPLDSSTRRAQESCDRQMSSGSCSTIATSSTATSGSLPASCVRVIWFRVIWGNSSCAVASGTPRRSNRIALLDVVPWSSARTHVFVGSTAVIVPLLAWFARQGSARGRRRTHSGHTVPPVVSRIRPRPRPRAPTAEHRRRTAIPPRR